jgi:hypothetical protein
MPLINHGPYQVLGERRSNPAIDDNLVRRLPAIAIGSFNRIPGRQAVLQENSDCFRPIQIAPPCEIVDVGEQRGLDCDSHGLLLGNGMASAIIFSHKRIIADSLIGANRLIPLL